MLKATAATRSRRGVTKFGGGTGKATKSDRTAETLDDRPRLRALSLAQVIDSFFPSLETERTLELNSSDCVSR